MASYDGLDPYPHLWNEAVAFFATSLRLGSLGPVN